jgi:hypothetical protein
MYSDIGRVIVEVLNLIHRHATHCRTPLDEMSAGRKDLSR